MARVGQPRDVTVGYIKLERGAKLGSSYKYLAEMGTRLESSYHWGVTLGRVLRCVFSGVCAEVASVDYDRLTTLMVRCGVRRDESCARLAEYAAEIARQVHERAIEAGKFIKAPAVEGERLAAAAEAVRGMMRVQLYLLDRFDSSERWEVLLARGIPKSDYKYFFILTSPILNKFNVYSFAVEVFREAFGSATENPKSLSLTYYVPTKEGLRARGIPVMARVMYEDTAARGGPELWGLAGFHGLVKPLVETLRNMGFTVSFPGEAGWRPGPSRTVRVRTDVLRQLRPYQEAALKAWLDAGGLGTIVLPTGGGKTHVALAAIAKLRVPTAIFVTTIELAQQWRRKIKEVLGYDAGLVGGGEKTVRDITVVIYNSGSKHIDELYDRFVMHIYDEGHHLPAESFKVIALKSRTWYRMVLSATPKRADKNEKLIFALAGPTVYKMSHAALARQGYLVPVDYRVVTVELLPDEWERYRELEREGKHAKALEAAAASKAKIPVLVDIVRRELEANPSSKIIVFTQYLRQAEEAAAALEEALGRGRVALLTGKMSRRSREASMEAFKSGRARVLIATTVADEGIDVPDADVAVILSGYSQERQFIQRIGRVVRGAAGKRKAKIYEVVARDTRDQDLHERRMQALLEGSVATVKELGRAEEEARKRRAQSRGRVAEVLAVELGDGYAALLKKTVKELTRKELKALVKASRSRPPRSWKLDEARKGRVPRRVETWVKAPDKYDIPGVDTPDAPHARARRKLSESASRNIRNAMKRPPRKCTVRETRDGYYAVICYHEAGNGKTVPVMHGKFTTRQAAQRKARLAAAGKKR